MPAVALLAFGPRSTEKLPSDRTIVEYWETWTGDEEAKMRIIVDEFNDTVGEQKKIFVRYMSTSEVQKKTLIATAAGVPPDIAGMGESQLVQFAALGALEPLDADAAAAAIDSNTYQKVYWDGCTYHGHLWALISTPAMIALHYNRAEFEASGDKLRAAGLDPSRAPQTIDELDRYSDALTILDARGAIKRAGYIPMEPGWYVPHTSLWFGSEVWDEQTGKFLLTTPKVIKAFTWLANYSKKNGIAAESEFRGGMSNFDSPQNGFLTGALTMEQQGPWMANFIETLKPSLNRLPGFPPPHPGETVAERRARCAWAVAPFPSDDPNLKDVSYATYNIMTIPRGAKHHKEAFEFMAFVNRQDVMERLCASHCKNSPLRKVSEQFINNHPNPYIEVFERLAASPNAKGPPKIPILQEVLDEMNNVAQQVTLGADVTASLAAAQSRLEASWKQFSDRQRARRDQGLIPKDW